MTPSDDRVLQLLRKWHHSLELHSRYVGLPEEQYWLVQPWPNHQRPTKWVVQLARQRVEDLMHIVQTRVAAGDSSLSEALELMSFLTNLVGSQHVERFVPLAESENERPLSSITMETPGPAPVDITQSGTREMPAPTPVDTTRSSTREMPVRARTATSQSATHEMPTPPPALTATSRHKATSARSRTRARTAPTPAAAAAAAAARASASTSTSGATTPAAPTAAGAKEVIADAARLLKWGRAWHELPDAIARLAGRPAADPIREILKTHRAAIERQALDAG